MEALYCALLGLCPFPLFNLYPLAGIDQFYQFPAIFGSEDVLGPLDTPRYGYVERTNETNHADCLIERVEIINIIEIRMLRKSCPKKEKGGTHLMLASPDSSFSALFAVHLFFSASIM